MDKWIRDLISASVAGVIALATATWERIAWLYATIVTVGLSVKSGWSRLLNGVRHATSHIVGLAQEAYVTFWWIVKVFIPQSISHAFNTVTDWVSRELYHLGRTLGEAVANVRDWLSDRINAVTSFVSQLARWAGAQIADIVNVLEHVADLVFMLLTSPERMARWLIGALAREALSFIDSHADALLEMVRRRSILYAAQAADRIEEMLVRFL